ncbi:MAG: PKD domain-containing protein [Pirellulales bacterium]
MEGQTATASGTWSDPGLDDVTLSASVGSVTRHADGTWTWSYATTDGPEDTQEVTITAKDSDGAKSSTTFQLTVDNVAATISSDGDVTVSEGQTATASGTWSDPGLDEVTLSASVGSVTRHADGTWTWSYATTDGPEDTQEVTITATDSDGATSSTTFQLTVESGGGNEAPEIVTIVSDALDCSAIADDRPVVIRGTYHDDNAGDTHSLVVNWGDGNSEVIVASDTRIQQSADAFEIRHRYGAGGVYQVQVTVLDAAGAGDSAVTQAAVRGIGLSEGRLSVIGTSERDQVHVARVSGDMLRVRTDAGRTLGDEDEDDDLSDGKREDDFDRERKRVEFPLSKVSSIFVLLCASNDWLHVNNNVMVPVTVDGGTGNDRIKTGGGTDVVVDGSGDNRIRTDGGDDKIITGNGRDRIWAGDGADIVDSGGGNDDIEAGAGQDVVFAGAGSDRVRGGAGNDILVGGTGDDELAGETGRDLLIAGTGRDTLWGNADDDLLIAGSTAFDEDRVALQAILAEWSRTDLTASTSYAVRVAHLTGATSGGLNGAFFLRGDNVAGSTGNQTVFDDNECDRLTGSAGADWFLINSVSDNSSVKDLITDKALAELATDVDLDL